MAANYSEMLTAISQYQMTKEEALAYRVAVMYLELAHQYFPKSIHEKFGKGDPRETDLFRHCWKLLRETKNTLNPTDYRNYITAQFQILKGIPGSLVSIKSIVGYKAWIRWQLWKNKNQKVQDAPIIDETPPPILGSDDLIYAIRDKLIKSHKFVMSHLAGKDISVAVKDKRLKRWIKVGCVDPIYALLHPKINQDDDIGIDPSLYNIDNEKLKQIFLNIYNT